MIRRYSARTVSRGQQTYCACGEKKTPASIYCVECKVAAVHANRERAYTAKKQRLAAMRQLARQRGRDIAGAPGPVDTFGRLMPSGRDA